MLNKLKENKMKTYQIFTVSKYNGNAFIMENSGNGSCEFLWTAPLFKDNTVDNTQWGTVDDDVIVNDVLNSNEIIVIDEITIQDFNKLLGIE